MVSLLQRVHLSPPQSDKALQEALRSTDEVGQREGALRELKIEASLGLPARTDESDLEVTLQALAEVRPEAQRYFIQRALHVYYGLSSQPKAEEVIPYEKIEERMNRFVLEVKQFGHRAELYQSGTPVYQKNQYRNLEFLVEVNVVDGSDVEILKASLKRLHTALQEVPKDEQSYKTYFSHLTGLIAGGITASAIALIDIPTFLVDTEKTYFSLSILTTLLMALAGVVSYCVGEVYSMGSIDSRKHYNSRMAQLTIKHKDPLATDLEVSRYSAEQVQSQLQHPRQIRRGYQSNERLAKVHVAQEQAQKYLSETINSLRKLEQAPSILKPDLV